MHIVKIDSDTPSTCSRQLRDARSYYGMCFGGLVTRPERSLLGRKEMFYLTTHSTHFIYGYMASDVWQRTTQIGREKTRCRHIGYSFRLAASVTDRITHTTTFVTPVVDHWQKREISSLGCLWSKRMFGLIVDNNINISRSNNIFKNIFTAKIHILIFKYNITTLAYRFSTSDFNSLVNLESSERRKEMFYLTTHSTQFIYGYMTSDIW